MRNRQKRQRSYESEEDLEPDFEATPRSPVAQRLEAQRARIAELEQQLEVKTATAGYATTVLDLVSVGHAVLQLDTGRVLYSNQRFAAFVRSVM